MPRPIANTCVPPQADGDRLMAKAHAPTLRGTKKQEEVCGWNQVESNAIPACNAEYDLQ